MIKYHAKAIGKDEQACADHRHLQQSLMPRPVPIWTLSVINRPILIGIPIGNVQRTTFNFQLDDRKGACHWRNRAPDSKPQSVLCPESVWNPSQIRTWHGDRHDIDRQIWEKENSAFQERINILRETSFSDKEHDAW